MNKTTLYIYMLVDPRNDKPFYVGRTINPKRRYTDHLRDGRKYADGKRVKADDGKCRIISEVIANDMLPIMRILDNCIMHPSMIDSYRILDMLENMWASRVEMDNRLWLEGEHRYINYKEGLGKDIEKWKHWLETGIRPKLPRRSPAEMAKRWQEAMEDLEKLRAGKTLW
jgi:hypothetical protein